ncbi:MAG: hypothetical protein LBQ10_06195 [Desulfovibrio sp.]|jgi:hypothetical protein|nr:hypothetical protein [Desulfovibrio sp.]
MQIGENPAAEDIRLSVEKNLSGRRRYRVEVRRAGFWSTVKNSVGELLLFENAAAAKAFMGQSPEKEQSTGGASS